MELPFFPADQFGADRSLLLEVIREIGLDAEQRFILGRHTAAFERMLGDSLGVADVVACGSGTSALTMVLRAMEVGAGDEVVVPAFGCAPLAASVLNAGATPVFADILPHTMVVDPAAMAALIGPRTKVLMPAHMFSVLADLPRIEELAARHGVRLLEDSAVAQGAVLRGRPAGTWGDAGVFSFVQVKSFGMPGEGGAVVTGDPALGEAVRLLRNHGQDGVHRFVHHRIGYNSRFDEIQAAFQLRRYAGFPARLARRARIAEYYTERFAGLREAGVLPPPSGRDGRCYYVYCLLCERRDELKEWLAERGIGAHVYYPLPLPRQAAFAAHAMPGQQWPNAEHASARILALPVYPQLSDAEVECIADAVCEFAMRHAALPTP
ncbi:DegT/DnrJ/EryC1/StrS family aminotransferase [Amycolatopsis nigrescens]|uniref:DegT/DnrJ/EryC1/StrS family aminotransferase n=1 Tax=Amycolatopsis nigrescens TaxID=381445 RepID=UPI00068527BB|nr:DegT/DnrJ/EryC1/StrS family aminotransferase [Amycolatopsis nigrescens]